jgi:hypothetical protein
VEIICIGRRNRNSFSFFRLPFLFLLLFPQKIHFILYWWNIIISISYSLRYFSMYYWLLKISFLLISFLLFTY